MPKMNLPQKKLPIIGHFINGQTVVTDTGTKGDVFNPATGEKTAHVVFADVEQTNNAIEVAAAAFPAWAATPPAKRAQILFNYRDLIRKHANEIAELLCKEHGKVLSDGLGSLQRGLEVVEFACGIPQLLKGSYSEGVANGVDSYAVRQPLGVCVGITPFNFPTMVPMWMYPLAIACGNTFVLKPSEKTPSATLRLVELMTEAGLPDGVLNLINGDKTAVDVLLRHPKVAAVSFVGSTSIGEYVYRTGTQHGKRVQALCGAKNHLVVMPDADMQQTTDALIGSAYGSAGERCMAISVAVTVGEGTAERLLEKLVPRVEALKLGPYSDPAAEMGPLVTAAHHEKVSGFIQQGIEDGAKLLVDGRKVSLQGYEQGYFLGGCLFDQVTTDMSIYKEEIFGPVLSMVRAADYETAVSMVNDHEYGNGSAIFTSDGGVARDYCQRVQIGMVGVNVPIPVPVAYHSFGGWKRSLFGDHSIHGEEGVHFYTHLKTITTRWPAEQKSRAEFHFKSGAE